MASWGSLVRPWRLCDGVSCAADGGGLPTASGPQGRSSSPGVNGRIGHIHFHEQVKASVSISPQVLEPVDTWLVMTPCRHRIWQDPRALCPVITCCCWSGPSLGMLGKTWCWPCRQHLCGSSGWSWGQCPSLKAKKGHPQFPFSLHQTGLAAVSHQMRPQQAPSLQASRGHSLQTCPSLTLGERCQGPTPPPTIRHWEVMGQEGPWDRMGDKEQESQNVRPTVTPHPTLFFG